MRMGTSEKSNRLYSRFNVKSSAARESVGFDSRRKAKLWLSLTPVVGDRVADHRQACALNAL
jgi:hypothetical protein